MKIGYVINDDMDLCFCMFIYDTKKYSTSFDLLMVGRSTFIPYPANIGLTQESW